MNVLKNIRLEPSITLVGNVIIPPSKSLSHRSIIAAGLAKGTSEIDNIIESNDIVATSNCMKLINAETKYENNRYIVKGNGGNFNVVEPLKFQCNESGSTLRFMIPLGTLVNKPVVFIGKGTLNTRPLDPFFEIFKEQGISYSYDNSLPLKIYGTLKAGIFNIRGDISSQFISGLMYTLPLLDGDSIINITTELESKGYLDLTIDVLDKFGVHIENRNYEQFIIKGNQEYKSANYRVEGDYSQVAFWIVAGLINGSISCSDMRKDSKQGDREILDIVKRMKGEFTFSGDTISVKKSETIATIIDGSQCPDIIPVLAVLASVSKGETRIINASRLRIKECDRLKAISEELTVLGADITEIEDGLIINGKEKLNGGYVKGWNDHRIVMSLAIASLVCENPVFIKGSDAITKSYPHFFEQFMQLGGKVDEWNMEK